MMRIRKEIFPMLSQDKLPPDLLHFKKHYIQRGNSTVYAARIHDGTLIGTIGIYPYDGRFDQLIDVYNHTHTAEIVKCYIDSKYRRLGIGTTLFKKALKFSMDAGYQNLYLHTHPFLPGAISFWENQGFEIRLAEEDAIWKTVHMDRNL
ncbi:GNAT family N-acetyltransferase [Bacillus sp. SD075]|nr:GNAT family N-acetyltransferase [Bacillus sp. SD075]